MNDYIQKQVAALIRRFGTRDPFEIAAQTGLNVVFWDIGKLKGMYKIVRRNRFAAINETLDERTSRLVLAHELGHDVLHRELAQGSGMPELTLCSMKTPTEYEANLFAAELLLDDEEITALAAEGYCTDGIAKALGIDSNLVNIKLFSMNMRGYSFNVPDYKSDFLG